MFHSFDTIHLQGHDTSALSDEVNAANVLLALYSDSSNASQGSRSSGSTSAVEVAAGAEEQTSGQPECRRENAAILAKVENQSMNRWDTNNNPGAFSRVAPSGGAHARRTPLEGLLCYTPLARDPSTTRPEMVLVSRAPSPPMDTHPGSTLDRSARNSFPDAFLGNSVHCSDMNRVGSAGVWSDVPPVLTASLEHQMASMSAYNIFKDEVALLHSAILNALPVPKVVSNIPINSGGRRPYFNHQVAVEALRRLL